MSLREMPPWNVSSINWMLMSPDGELSEMQILLQEDKGLLGQLDTMPRVTRPG